MQGIHARESELSDTFDAATATISLTGIVTGWSEGARRLLGHEAQEVVGRPARDLLVDREVPRVGRPPSRDWHGTAVLRHRDGRPVELTLPFAVIVLRPVLRGVPPELEEAPLVDGCGLPGVLLRVVLPITVPSLVATAGLSFLLTSSRSRSCSTPSSTGTAPHGAP